MQSLKKSMRGHRYNYPFRIFLGVLDIPDFFFQTEDAGTKPMCEEKMTVPPPPPPAPTCATYSYYINIPQTLPGCQNVCNLIKADVLSGLIKD